MFYKFLPALHKFLPASIILGTCVVGTAALLAGTGGASPTARAAGAFSDSFDGAPGAPLSFDSAHWEIAAHELWGEPLDRVNAVLPAQHGPNCEPPGEDGSVTHPVVRYSDFVYQCRDHIMTVANTTVYLTPDHMVDLSAGPAVIRFDVSTVSRSTRDWIDVWVQAWDTQEQAILDDETGAQANPRNAVHIEQGAGCCSPRSDGIFHVEVFNGSRQRVARLEPVDRYWTTVLKPSAQTRSTVEIVLSRTHIKVWMPQHNLVWIDQDIPSLGFTEGLVSFGHHSYSPDKG